MAKKSTRARQSRQPEEKIGPFAGGIGVAIWLNSDDNFCEWAYDDRLYRDPWMQDVTKEEHNVLSRYLR